MSENEIRLSSKWTILSMLAILLLFIVGLPLIWFRQQSMRLEFMVVLSDLIVLVLFGFFVYLFVNVCTATIVGNKLFLRKLVGIKKEFSFSQVVKVSSITMRATKYIFVKVRNEAGRLENFIILNPVYMIPEKNKDAEKVLNSYLDK